MNPLDSRTTTRIPSTLAVAALSLASAATLSCGAAPAGSDPARDCTPVAADGHATDLICTGLYADSTTGTLSPDVSRYEPSNSAWADGAEKQRFIRLPPGTAIDTHDMDRWVFPVGTKLWKEFSLGGHKLETRYEEKRANGTWLRTTYVWSADETHATEVTGGVPNVRGSGYEIPAQDQCATCHMGARDGVLGFEAIGLSGPGASGLMMSELVRQRLVTDAPSSPLTIPGTPTEAAALGWLHANCGNACHNRMPRAAANWTGLFMRLTVSELGSVQSTDTHATAVGVASNFQPVAGEKFFRIATGDVAHSAVPYRALARDNASHAGVQMPPIGTHVPDMAGVALVQAWIHAM
jgi:hypothetical protein